jgi:hypothetical protein
MSKDLAFKVLTPKLCLSLLAEIVEEFGGDHVYEKICRPGSDIAGCLNWDKVNDCPSCLVGHVMHRFGIPAEFLASNSASSAHGLCTDINYSEDLLFTVEDATFQILMAVQEAQDFGRPWGTALALGVKAFLAVSETIEA